MKFNGFVSPGHSLNITATVFRKSDTEYTFKAAGKIDGEASAVSARVTLEQFNMADRNPDLAESDERRRTHFRREWSTVWTPPAE